MLGLGGLATQALVLGLIPCRGVRIHHTAAFRYAEQAEIAFLRKLGLLRSTGKFPRRRVEADYLKALRFDDAIEVRIRPERIGRTSVTWAWEIRRDDETCVVGRHTMVHVDEHGLPTPLPGEMRARLADHVKPGGEVARG